MTPPGSERDFALVRKKTSKKWYEFVSAVSRPENVCTCETWLHVRRSSGVCKPGNLEKRKQDEELGKMVSPSPPCRLPSSAFSWVVPVQERQGPRHEPCILMSAYYAGWPVHHWNQCTGQTKMVPPGLPKRHLRALDPLHL